MELAQASIVPPHYSFSQLRSLPIMEPQEGLLCDALLGEISMFFHEEEPKSSLEYASRELGPQSMEMLLCRARMGL